MQQYRATRRLARSQEGYRKPSSSSKNELRKRLIRESDPTRGRCQRCSGFKECSEM